MKKLLLLTVFLMSVLANSQNFCSVAISPTYTFYPNTTTVQNFGSSDAIVMLCGSNTILYDTVSPVGGCRVVYLNSGTKYQLKNIGCPTNSEIYAKNNSTVIATENVQSTIYYEPNATIINLANPSTINTVSCTSISFPNVDCGVNGIKSNKLDDNTIIVYPNPASDELNVTFSVQTKINICPILIYNSFGQLIKQEEINFKTNQAKVEIANLSNGVYYLNLRGENKKFVIAK